MGVVDGDDADDEERELREEIEEFEAERERFEYGSGSRDHPKMERSRVVVDSTEDVPSDGMSLGEEEGGGRSETTDFNNFSFAPVSSNNSFTFSGNSSWIALRPLDSISLACLPTISNNFLLPPC